MQIIHTHGRNLNVQSTSGQEITVLKGLIYPWLLGAFVMLMIDIYSRNPLPLSMPYPLISLLTLLPCHYVFLLIQIRFCSLRHTLLSFTKMAYWVLAQIMCFPLFASPLCQRCQEGPWVSCHRSGFVPRAVEATDLINNFQPSLINIVLVIWGKCVHVLQNTECFM